MKEGYAKSHDGLKIHYEFHSSNGPVLVFSHGLAMDLTSWQNQIDYFKKDYSVLAYDLRGHGKSSKPREMEYYSLDNLVNDVDTLTDALDIDKFSLIGFSLGGSIALRYSQLHPEKLEKVVAINTPYNLNSVRMSFFIQLGAVWFVPKQVIGFGLDKDPIWQYKNDIDTYRKCFTSTEKFVIMNTLTSLAAYRPRDLDVNVDHLLIHSSEDEIVKPNPPQGKNAEFIDDGHHYVIAQKPKEVNKIISEFLK